MFEQKRRLWWGMGFVMALAGLPALIWWQARWRVPVRKVERESKPNGNRGVKPETPSHLQKSDGITRPLQLAADGDGPLYMRRYRAAIVDPELTPTELIRAMRRDINAFTPRELAYFEKTVGAPGEIQLNDEFHIHISGPWDGPVHTIDVTPTSFSFATLEGHMEAGEILFQTTELTEEELTQRQHRSRNGVGMQQDYAFEIVSWARSRDLLVDLTYDKLGAGKFMQQSMWVFFCKQAVEASGGKLLGEIRVFSKRTPVDDRAADAAVVEVHDRPRRKKAAPGAPWERYQSQLDGLVDLTANFDLESDEAFTAANGWQIDDYVTELPTEAPGEPVSGGSWEQAKQVLLNYEFPDPGILTGFYAPDSALDQRSMLLRARFLFFTFEFGVRIRGVVDTTLDDVDGRGPARVWGYSYYTLEGHFEMGEITFSVLKFLETGEVEFRIHAYSRTGHISNIFYRMGFAIFGRWLQVRFARKALERMRGFVTARLEEQEAEKAAAES